MKNRRGACTNYGMKSSRTDLGGSGGAHGTYPNGRHHSILFVDKLHRVLRYAQIVCPTKYEEALDQYVTQPKKATRKVKFSQLHDNNLSINSDDSTHTRKRGNKRT